MEHLQRAILLIIVCLLVVSPAYLEYQQNCYYLEDWTEAQTVCFFEEVCSQGFFTAKEYFMFCESVRSACETEEIFFEEFKQSFGVGGKEYRSYISWDEMKEIMESDGRYEFQENSEVRLYLDEKGYFGLVRGKHEAT